MKAWPLPIFLYSNKLQRPRYTAGSSAFTQGRLFWRMLTKEWQSHSRFPFVRLLTTATRESLSRPVSQTSEGIMKNSSLWMPSELQTYIFLLIDNIDDASVFTVPVYRNLKKFHSTGSFVLLGWLWVNLLGTNVEQQDWRMKNKKVGKIGIPRSRATKSCFIFSNDFL